MSAICLAAVVASAQADSVRCRRVGRCSTSGQASCVPVSGNYVYVDDDMFGLRTIEVGDLQSSADGACFDAQDSA